MIAAQPGAATMCDGLLGAVVDHLLSLDVEIKWQDIAERAGRSYYEWSFGQHGSGS